jgi:hypothetical protein
MNLILLLTIISCSGAFVPRSFVRVYDVHLNKTVNDCLAYSSFPFCLYGCYSRDIYNCTSSAFDLFNPLQFNYYASKVYNVTLYRGSVVLNSRN